MKTENLKEPNTETPKEWLPAISPKLKYSNVPYSRTLPVTEPHQRLCSDGSNKVPYLRTLSLSTESLLLRTRTVTEQSKVP